MAPKKWQHFPKKSLRLSTSDGNAEYERLQDRLVTGNLRAVGCVDTLRGVRYAFGFTRLEIFLLRETDKLANG